jgi:hypothetical protein
MIYIVAMDFNPLKRTKISFYHKKRKDNDCGYIANDRLKSIPTIYFVPTEPLKKNSGAMIYIVAMDFNPLNKE